MIIRDAASSSVSQFPVRRLGAYLLAALVATGLTACVGGGSPNQSSTANIPRTSAEGVYEATMPGAPYPALQAVILENGDVWTTYGDNLGSVFNVASFSQGNGASSNGNAYNSTNVKDFGFAPAVAGTLSATFNANAKTISGTTTFSSLTRQFSGAAFSSSTYSYDSPASLSLIAGRWSSTPVSGEGQILTISTSGSFTLLRSGGCTATGNIAPRASGKNVFNIVGTFGPAPCVLANQTFSGIGISYLLATGQTQFIGAAVDSTRTYGSVIVGVKSD